MELKLSQGELLVLNVQLIMILQDIRLSHVLFLYAVLRVLGVIGLDAQNHVEEEQIQEQEQLADRALRELQHQKRLTAIQDHAVRLELGVTGVHAVVLLAVWELELELERILDHALLVLIWKHSHVTQEFNAYPSVIGIILLARRLQEEL